jgi:hypothetical protein
LEFNTPKLPVLKQLLSHIKEELVYKLGADSVVADGEALLKEKGQYGRTDEGREDGVGGADIILATSNSYKATADGRFILMRVSTTEPFTISPEILFKRARIIVPNRITKSTYMRY